MTHGAGFSPIEDYFIVGDLRTAALISRQGSIDWLCLPHFDSPSIFGELLDPAAGCFRFDMPDYSIEANYIEQTAIVAFRLSHDDNHITITDFMVPHPTKTKVNQQLVRAISASNSPATARFIFQPKQDYGTAAPRIQTNNGRLTFAYGKGSIVLHLPADAKVTQQADHYQISVLVEPGRSKQLVLEFVPKPNKPSINHNQLESQTQTFWQDWVDKGQFIDFCRGPLIRSAIALKLMQFYPTGAIVAAPTTSLPEEIGGVRNWDYRYVWIRDATFALYAFYVLGYDEEAHHFFDFIEQVTEQCAEADFDVSLMYTIWGGPVPAEQLAPHLSGYKDSGPVRTGNQAAEQFQLDVYGSLIDALYFASGHGLTEANKRRLRRLVMQLVRKIDKLWQQPDYGIWEARTAPKQYTYSRVMAWVGADRANRLRETLGLTYEDVQVCTSLAGTIRDWIWQHCYDQKRQTLTQYPGAEATDATNLLFVLLQFLDKHQPLTKEILGNTVKELGNKEIFVYRYLAPDGLPGNEGAFWLCSFWLVSALAILEDVDTALPLFRALEHHMNNQYLLSEEIDPKTGAYLGNYLQSFSHMGYVMSAYYIHKYATRKGVKLE